MHFDRIQFGTTDYNNFNSGSKYRRDNLTTIRRHEKFRSKFKPGLQSSYQVQIISSVQTSYFQTLVWLKLEKFDK